MLDFCETIPIVGNKPIIDSKPIGNWYPNIGIESNLWNVFKDK